jgi:hypothetical protein
MKSLAISIILFTVCTAGIILNSVYIRNGCEKISSYAEEISAHQSSSRELESYWNSNRLLFGISVSVAKTERMDELIISLRSAIAEKNLYEIERICRLIIALAEDISIDERLSLQGIF